MILLEEFERKVGRLLLKVKRFHAMPLNMQLAIVESSPLAQNMYRLLLQHYAPDLQIDMFDSLSALDNSGPKAGCCGLIVGGQALSGEGHELRALLTDVAAWAELPKLIIAQEPRTDHAAPWEGLPSAQTLHRPFRPEAFRDALQAFMQEGS